jgi:hypothetical protein
MKNFHPWWEMTVVARFGLLWSRGPAGKNGTRDAPATKIGTTK